VDAGSSEGVEKMKLEVSMQNMAEMILICAGIKNLSEEEKTKAIVDQLNLVYKKGYETGVEIGKRNLKELS
jgi:hypothetical protein